MVCKCSHVLCTKCKKELIDGTQTLATFFANSYGLKDDICVAIKCPDCSHKNIIKLDEITVKLTVIK